MAITFSALMAELADAAYAKFDQKNIEDALDDRKFADTQIATFIEACSIVPGTHNPDTETGFAATLCQALAGAPGKYGAQGA